MIFKDPWFLYFIPLVVLFVFFMRKRDNASNIRFSSERLLGQGRLTFRLFVAKNLYLFRAFVIIFFLIALARPRIPLEEAKVESEGVDIVLAIDSSGSMLAEDFKVGGFRKNRLAVVKEVVEEFIRERHSDRIGMITFAARAYTVCPLTLDYDWLVKNLERVEIGAIEDGTAVGSAISSSLNRLKSTQARSKIIILLTDGINNAGRIPPLTAAEAAKALGIKVYTIGAGTEGLVPYPMQQIRGRKIYKNIEIKIDEETLKKIAQLTNGKYYRATDVESLREIYKEIDALEKTKVEEQGFQEFQELFGKFLTTALGLLLLEIILSGTLARKLP